MVDKNAESDIFGINRIEDVRWLCSLSETELDALIWIKTLVLFCTKRIGNESLAQEFDLKALRSLSLTMMEHLSDQLKGSSAVPSFAEAAKLLGQSNLSSSRVNGEFSSMSARELWDYICQEKKRRIAEIIPDEKGPRKKRRVAGKGLHFRVEHDDRKI